MGFELPAGDVPVSASWQSHKDRNPPSSEPGTDYACAYGTIVVAVDDATVMYTQTHPGGGTGRYVEYRTDAGKDARTLHLSEVWASPDERVARNQAIGVSGASGYGSDWYYGPHAHQTLWPGGSWDADTIDFELYVVTPEPADDVVMEMLILIANAEARQ